MSECRLAYRAFSQDTLLVFLRGFVPVPPSITPPVQEDIPAAILMPPDEKSRNFPQIITFQVEVVRGTMT